MKRNLAILVVVVAGFSGLFFAQDHKPANNAALRYWMAFAQMNDSQISPDDTERIDTIVSGKAPWDEARFGALVERNKVAIETMIRGTHLSYCEWGIEYSLGPDAPVAYLPKARAMARLDRLYAERLAASGDYDGAIRATVAGLRFSQHMAQNASFFGAMTAKVAMMTQLEEVQQLAESEHLSPTQLQNLRTATAALPEGGFDWQISAKLEATAMSDAMRAISRATDPQGLYRRWLGDPPADFHAPSESEIRALDGTMVTYEKLLGMSPEAANSNLPALQRQISHLDSGSQALIPSPARILAARRQLIDSQNEAAKALGVH